MTIWESTEALGVLDAKGYTVVEAITTRDDLAAATGTHAEPNAFLGVDGKSYWVKARAQQGLVSELIAGRLAHEVGAGPNARIIRVTPECFASNAVIQRLVGVFCGIEHVHGVINSKDLQPLLANGSFKPDSIDPQSRAVTVVFQTWLGMADQQLLVGVQNGRVYTIDHGEWFNDGRASLPIQMVVAPIPGVDETVGRDVNLVDVPLRRIESLSDADLLTAVSQVPIGAEWGSPAQRRLAIGAWLAERRANLRTVVEAWARS